MYKVFGAGDQERLLAEGPVTRLITTNASIKEASSSKITRELLETFKPDKDSFLIHTVAMGDDEHYGFNRNCWPAGTPVRTPRGFRSIETLQVDDLVLTAAGTFKPVSKTFRHTFNGTEVLIEAWNLAKPVVCTGEHPLLVLRQEHTSVGKLNPKIKGKRQGASKISENFARATVQATFVEANTIRPGDWLCIPCESSVGSTITWDPWLLGLYVAEGCLVKEYKDIATKGEYKSLLFALGAHDDAGVIPRLMSATRALNRAVSVQPSYTSEHGRRVTLGHKKLAEFCHDTFGGHSTSKTLGAEIFSQTREWKLKFLAGLFDGDGCSSPDNSLSLSTASFDLASCVQRLLSSCDVVASVQMGHNDSSNGCFGGGRHVIYTVQVGACRSNEIKRYSARHKTHAKAYGVCSKARCANGNLWVRVRKVEMTETSKPVFNLEVADEHTYVTTVAGHNCDAWTGNWLNRKHATFVTHGHYYREHENRRKDQRIGSIKASAYDPEMGRVELIIHGALKPREGEPLTAEPEYERAKAGKNVDGSMSCKIKGDTCSCCGNFAPNASAYCDCFRNYRGQWHPKYQKMAYVLNPDPLFFDYSSVKNRADRTARFLEYKFNDGSGCTAKAASNEPYSMTGADLAEAYNITEPRIPMTKDTLQRIARLKEAAYWRKDREFIKIASAVAPAGELTEKEVEVFSKARTPSLLRKLAKAKVVLPFHSYAAVFGGMTLKAAAEDAVLQRAMAIKEDGDDLDAAEDMGTPDMEITFVCAMPATEDVDCDEVDALMDGVSDRLGMRDGVDDCHKRAYPELGYKLAASRIVLTAAQETMARAWAASYGVYKASCLRELETLHGDSASTLTPVLAVL